MLFLVCSLCWSWPLFRSVTSPVASCVLTSTLADAAPCCRALSSFVTFLAHDWWFFPNSSFPFCWFAGPLLKCNYPKELHNAVIIVFLTKCSSCNCSPLLRGSINKLAFGVLIGDGSDLAEVKLPWPAEQQGQRTSTLALVKVNLWKVMMTQPESSNERCQSRRRTLLSRVGPSELPWRRQPTVKDCWHIHHWRLKFVCTYEDRRLFLDQRRVGVLQ